MVVLLRSGNVRPHPTRRGSSPLSREKPHPFRHGCPEGPYAAWLTPAAHASVTREPGDLCGRRGWKQVLLLLHTVTPQEPPEGNPVSGHGRSICKATSVSTQSANPHPSTAEHGDVASQTRDISEVPAIEVITTAAIHLMSAAAVKCGLAEGPDAADHLDLDEARRLINALAGLITASAPDLGSQHAAPLRDGLKSLQLAFREASVIPDPPGQGPGEKLTGSVV